MFKNLRATENKNLNNSGRSHFGETLQLEGDLRSSGSIDVAGLINGNVFVSEMTVAETGSVRGSVEAGSIEINGHIEGKITADAVIVGKNAVVKPSSCSFSNRRRATNRRWSGNEYNCYFRSLSTFCWQHARGFRRH